jgi:hypothetical protein
MTNVWHRDYMFGIEWNGERWLSVLEQSALLHVVKFSEACTYRAAYKPPGA